MPILDRDFIVSGGLTEAIRDAERQGLIRLSTPAERTASRRAILADHRPGDDIWLFAYGSLLWNPAVEIAERVTGRIYGFHRCFGIWTFAGRGTPEHPGLVLGLDRGGCCQGAALRLPPATAEQELEVIWGREMVADSYRPTWVNVHSPCGIRRAITFVTDRGHDRYAGRLPTQQVAQTLATAAGFLGTSAEYLESTAAHLHELGIDDHYLIELCRRVRRITAAPTP